MDEGSNCPWLLNEQVTVEWLGQDDSNPHWLILNSSKSHTVFSRRHSGKPQRQHILAEEIKPKTVQTSRYNYSVQTVHGSKGLRQ